MAKLTRKALNAFIKVFNNDHNFTKIVGVKTDLCALGKDKRKLLCWVLDIRVASYKDKRKALCHFFLNVWPNEDTKESISDSINDKYRGLREFLDQHRGIEEQVITKPTPEKLAA